MLATYRTQTAQLLQNPAAPSPLYSISDLDLWINRARQQLAGEGECIRVLGTVPTVAAQRPYSFAAINLGTSSITGINIPAHVRMLTYNVGAGQAFIDPRAWEWFNRYYLATPVPQSGAPANWAQLGQGAQGSFYVDPIPDAVYTINADTVCLPIDLVDDTTVEAIPSLWRDAVCYFSAYLALLSAQSQARATDAQRMLERYEEFVQRARRFATPSVNPGIYAQTPNPTQMNQLGLAPARQAQGGG